MHSDIKCRYFLLCIVLHSSNWKLHFFIVRLVNLAESLILWQISTFPLGIICLRVKESLGVVNPHTDTFLAYPLLQSTLVLCLPTLLATTCQGKSSLILLLVL